MSNTNKKPTLDELIAAVRTETKLEITLETMPQDRLYTLARESIEMALADARTYRQNLYRVFLARVAQ
jgi:hypothetical protein